MSRVYEVISPLEIEMRQRLLPALMTALLILTLAGLPFSSPAFSRAAPHSGTLVCQGVVEHSPNSNEGFYEIASPDEPCYIDGNTTEGKRILAVCHEGDMCELKAFGTWEVDFYVRRAITIEKLEKR